MPTSGGGAGRKKSGSKKTANGKKRPAPHKESGETGPLPKKPTTVTNAASTDPTAAPAASTTATASTTAAAAPAAAPQAIIHEPVVGQPPQEQDEIDPYSLMSPEDGSADDSDGDGDDDIGGEDDEGDAEGEGVGVGGVTMGDEAEATMMAGGISAADSAAVAAVVAAAEAAAAAAAASNVSVASGNTGGIGSGSAGAVTEDGTYSEGKEDVDAAHDMTVEESIIVPIRGADDGEDGDGDSVGLASPGALMTPAEPADDAAAGGSSASAAANGKGKKGKQKRRSRSKNHKAATVSVVGKHAATAAQGSAAVAADEVSPTATGAASGAAKQGMAVARLHNLLQPLLQLKSLLEPMVDEFSRRQSHPTSAPVAAMPPSSTEATAAATAVSAAQQQQQGNDTAMLLQFVQQQHQAKHPGKPLSAHRIAAIQSIISTLSAAKAGPAVVAVPAPVSAPSMTPSSPPAAASVPAPASSPTSPAAMRLQAPSVSQPVPTQHWGTLVSLVPQVPSCPLTGSVTLVGRSMKCHYSIPDTGLSSCIFRVHSQPPAVECATKQQALAVDGVLVGHGSIVPIRVGSEIRFQSPTAVYRFVYRAEDGTMPTPAVSPAPHGQRSSPNEAASAPVEQKPALAIEKHRDVMELLYSQPPAGAAAEASVSKAALAQAPTDTAAAATAPSASALAASPSTLVVAPETPSAPLPAAVIAAVVPMDVASTAEQPAPMETTAPTATTEVATAAAAAAASTATTDGAVVTPSAVAPAEVLPVAAPAPSASQSAERALEEVSAARAKYRDVFRAKVVKPADNTASLDNFPYFLSDDVRRILVSSAFVFLQRPEFAKYTSELSSLSRKILLTGPSGTELYQEALGKALAKHFSSSVLILEASDLEPHGGNSGGGSGRQDTHNVQQLAATARGFAAAVLGSLAGGDLQGASEDDDELADPRAALLFDSRIGRDGRLARPVLKKGDRVRYSGSQVVLHPDRSRSDKGPGPGARGTVVVTLEENPRKVGVQFDKPFAGGVDLGGMCTASHGMFVDTAALALEDGAAEDESTALEAVLEVLEETAPSVLVIKSVEKTMLSSNERYGTMKRMLAELAKGTKPIIVLGTTTGVPMEALNRDEKAKLGAAPMLVSKGSHHAAMVDFSFFDHLSRSAEERAAGGQSSGGLPKEVINSGRLLGKLFPTRIAVSVPKDGEKIAVWREQIDHDVECVKSTSNRASIGRALQRSNVAMTEELSMPALRKQVFSPDAVDKIVGWAISDHLQHAAAESVVVNAAGQLVISALSIEHAIGMLASSEPDARRRSLMEVETENEFEKRLLSEVIPPEEVSLSFGDIGALEEVKETLRELVMLPLQRPELFRRGNLTKPCKGILLFGPPGTGKTMLAKAVATESGANFINISMSSIASKWFGEGEKYVKAVFTLASKISPSVIFVDEVDSILGKRERAGEHEAMRKIKNEFMMNWDGLRTRQAERVLVLAATNRPMDLDDAVLRRLNKRILVDLPDAENREKILKVILHGEELEKDFDLALLAKKTEGFSGSDLKNLCVVAAHQPIRELLLHEKIEKERARKSLGPRVVIPASPPHIPPQASVAVAAAAAVPDPSVPPSVAVTPMAVDDQPQSGRPSDASVAAPVIAADSKPMPAPVPVPAMPAVAPTAAAAAPAKGLRNLTMGDFEKAMTEVSKSVHEDAFSLTELRQWNEMYGDSGTRSKPALSYYL